MNLSKEEVLITHAQINEEKIWVSRALANNAEAWEQLVRQHQEAVFRLAYLILGEASEAEEVSQEAFVRAYLSLKKFDNKRPFRPWLLQITANMARNRRRSLARYGAALRKWWQVNPQQYTGQERGEDAQLLWLAVQRLRPKAREIVYLRYFLEMSEKETAVILNIAPGTVKSRLHRALAQLRKIIQAEYPELAIGKKVR